MPTPHDCMKVAIARWEGLFQADPADPGNYLAGKLVGTMRGVTPAVLQNYLSCSASLITPEFMQERVTLDLAAEIGLNRYYKGWIDPIYWCAPADPVMDFGWGSGPGQAVKSTERDLLFLNNADFKFDQVSIAKWRLTVDTDGVVKMLDAWYDVRERFYDLICARNADLNKFRLGWHRRASWYRTGTEWWEHWRGESTGAVVDVVQPLPPVIVPTAILGNGSRGADVLSVQKRLIELGYQLPRSIRPDGSLDGIFGGEMDSVIRLFQERAGLTVDGWVGPMTRRALFGAGQFFGLKAA